MILKKKFKLSVIIPVYNEENTIAEIFRRVIAEKTNKEIIIVDDGSTDDSPKRIEQSTTNLPSRQAGKQQTTIKSFRHTKNLGKGAAIRTGIKHATGDVLIIQDADLEYNPDDYQKLLQPILEGKTKVVYGSRLKEMKFRLWGKDKTPLPTHYLANRLLSWLTNILYGSNLTDMETGYKMISCKVYKDLNLTSNGFEIEPEITVKAIKSGNRILEIPISTIPRGYGDGKKIKFKDAILAVMFLISKRLNPFKQYSV